MALEIKNTNGEICINGNASEMQLQQVRYYLKAFLTIKNEARINISQVKKGQKSLIKMIETLKIEIEAYQVIYYYGVKKLPVLKLTPVQTLPVSIYLAA